MLFFLHRFLSRTHPDASISTFTKAEDALSQILATGTDILITDHGMGSMSGTELIHELRGRGVTIPIIMLSGSPEEAAEAKLAGANQFIDKNTEWKGIEQRVHEIVEGLGSSQS